MENIKPTESVYKYLKGITGIGEYKAKDLCERLGIKKTTTYKEVTRWKKDKLTDKINSWKRLRKPEDSRYNQPIGFLRKKWEEENILELQEIGTYRGLRLKARYPVRGQRTRSNSKTASKRRL